MAKRSKPFEPYCVYDAMGFIRLLRIAAEQERDVVRLIIWDTTREYVHNTEVGVGQIAEYGSGRQARYITADCNIVHEAARMRGLAIRYGATPEAIRLLGLICPVTKKEEVEMAEKLKSKGGAAKSGTKAPANGDAEALKTAAKAAPVAKNKADAPKKRGNMEALAKARAAREGGNEERNKRKIVVLNKNHGARGGSNRANMLNIVLRAKTVGAAIEAGATWIDVKFAEKQGLIELK